MAAPLPDYVEAPLGESSWKAFFRPVRSAKSGTMPAGMVLVVTVMALVIALFLSASSISKRASVRPKNSEARMNLASAVATFSDTLRLNRPADVVEEAAAPYIGHEKKTENTSSEDVAASRAAAAAAAAGIDTGPTGAPQGNAEPGASTAPPTTVDPRPKLRAATVDQPLKVWVGGDSISYEPGVAVANVGAATKTLNVVTDSRPSTGLTRPDFFNWPQHLDRDVVPLDGGGVDPDIVMIMFGGNDAQNIPMPPPIGGYVIGSVEWQVEYRQRVADTMDILKSPTNDRLVMWLGAPIMGPGTVSHLDQIDYIYYSEAIKRPWVVYFDSWAFFTDSNGGYAKHLPAADGKTHAMRAGDDIHMSALGGDRLASAVYAKLATLVDLSAVPYVPDPEKAPPPGVGERAEVPQGEGQAPVP